MASRLLKFMKIKQSLLIMILLLAGFLRLWKLGVIPPHLTQDEAALGYNAYSILKTGKDEYGNFLPIIFKSFGDFKPGLYIYLTTPFVALLGLNELAVRLPSALSGILAVWLFYLLIKEVFKNNKLAIIASLLLVINPWHILFSRGAWEMNVCLTFTLAGIYFFFRSFKKQRYLIFSGLFFSSSLLIYQGAKLSSAIVVLLLVVLYRRQLLGFKKRTLLAAFLTGFFISLPIIFSLFQGKTGRLSVFSVFSYPRPEVYLQDFLDQGNEKVGSLRYYLFHSEALNFTRGVLGRWFNHFSTRFLFFEGDWQNPRHTAPNQGVLLFADLIALIFGFVSLTRLAAKREVKFVWLWLFLAPLPAALSRDQIQAVRSYNLLIPLMIVAAFGLRSLVVWIGRRRLRVAGCGIVILFYLASFTYFLDAYFIHLPKHDSKYWEYGYKQIVETVSPVQNNYQKIKVQQSFAQPYIFFLFYQKYDPLKYQKQARLRESEVGDVGQVEQLDNIEFSPIDWSINRREKGTLFVADPIRIPIEDSSDESLFRLLREIKYLNGEEAFRIIEVK